MSRCVICDAESSGLSDYRPDGRTSAHEFHLIMGAFYCTECANEIDEAESDFYVGDEGEEGGIEYDD